MNQNHDAARPRVWNSQTRDGALLDSFFTGFRALRGAVTAAALTGGTAVKPAPVLRRLAGAQPSLREVLRSRGVLVTGASSGIGHAVAFKVADADGIPILVARSEEKLAAIVDQIAARGGRAIAYAADLSSRESTHALLRRLESDGVVVDVLINNAGRSIRRPVEESYDRVHDFERTMSLNYFGSLRLILGLLPAMRARHSGHVINVSTSGVQVGTPLFSAYIASKAALDAFTRVASVEARSDGVLFTTVNMPLVRTPMIAPTQALQGVPALTAEEAADLVLRPLVTREKQLGTRLGLLFQLVHVLAPDLSEWVVSSGYRLGRTAAAGGGEWGPSRQ